MAHTSGGDSQWVPQMRSAAQRLLSLCVLLRPVAGCLHLLTDAHKVNQALLCESCVSQAAVEEALLLLLPPPVVLVLVLMLRGGNCCLHLLLLVHLLCGCTLKSFASTTQLALLRSMLITFSKEWSVTSLG